MPDNVVVPQLEPTALSTNGKETTPPLSPAAAGSDVIALFKAETTLMVWLIFLAFGGGILALYYARVRYLPDIEWSAALIYLGIGSIVGGAVGLLFAMSLLLPGLIWSEFLIFDSKLERVFCFDAGGKELCIGTIVTYLGIPFGLALLWSHLSLVVGQLTNSVVVGLAVYALVSVVLVVRFWPMMRSTFKRLMRPQSEGDRTAELSRRSLKCVFWFTLSLVLSQISIVTMYVLSKPKDLLSFFVLTFICTAGVLTSNHVVAMLYHRKSRQAIVATLVAAGFLLFTADWFSPLSLRIMGYYGLGGGRKVDLVLTEDGSKVVGDLGFTLCRTRTVCGAEILSKLGDEYYVVVDGKTFTLPKVAVQSYQSSDPRPPLTN